jgi:hypothetical protein
MRKSLAALIFLAVSMGHASAAPITFTFSTDVDATVFGLSASTPLTIQYIYDPSELGPTYTPDNVLYPIDFSITLGSFVVQVTYGGINTRIPPAYSYSQFVLSAATYADEDGVNDGHFTGDINGYQINDAELNILNQNSPITMLNSNSLPTSTAFISGADLIIVDINSEYNQAGDVQLYQQLTPGTFTFTEASAAPEASASLLAVVGISLVGILRFRKSSRRILR